MAQHMLRTRSALTLCAAVAGWSLVHGARADESTLSPAAPANASPAVLEPNTAAPADPFQLLPTSTRRAPANGPTVSPSAPEDQPVLLQTASTYNAPPIKPLFTALNYTPLGKPLQNMDISISGYVDGSWTYAAPPTEPMIAGRAFDTEPQSILLDQLDLDIIRPIDAAQGHFDVGFNIESIYGADAAYLHSNGLTFYSPSKILGAYVSGGVRVPKNQYDLNQAFISFAIPVGNGVAITIGQFDTLLGYEVTDNPLNPFFSHSFLFTQLNFTNTGGLVQYALNKKITVTAGATRGWDQSLKDTNGDWDITGQVKYSQDKINAFLNFITGNENPDLAPGVVGQDGWRTVLDYILSYNYSDNLILAVNADYGWQAQHDSRTLAPGGTAQWYGVAAYASYQLSQQFTLDFRGEWFDDQDGASPATFLGVPNTYYEASANVKIVPFPTNTILSNLVFRPEVRYDYADHPTWDAGHLRNQFTVALEGYFTF